MVRQHGGIGDIGHEKGARYSSGRAENGRTAGRGTAASCSTRIWKSQVKASSPCNVKHCTTVGQVVVEIVLTNTLSKILRFGMKHPVVRSLGPG